MIAAVAKATLRGPGLCGRSVEVMRVVVFFYTP